MPRARKSVAVPAATGALNNVSTELAFREVVTRGDTAYYHGNRIVIHMVAKNTMGRPVSVDTIYQGYIDSTYSREEFEEFCMLAGLSVAKLRELLPADGSRPTRFECPNCHMRNGSPSKKVKGQCSQCDGTPKE